VQGVTRAGDKSGSYMEDIRTGSGLPEHEAEFIFEFDETIDYSAPRFRGQAPTTKPATNDLTKYRCRDPVLSPDELAAALRAAQGADPVAAAAAKDKIFRRFHRLVLKEVKNHWNRRRDHDELFEELISAGSAAVIEAINRFDSRRNNGFPAYAKALIRGRMQTTVKRHRRNGLKIESRLARLLHGDHAATLGRAAEVMGRPVTEDELEAARDLAIGACSEPIEYDTREAGFDDDAKGGDTGEPDKPGFVAVAPLCNVQRYATCVMHRGQLMLTDAGLHLYGLANDADRRAAFRLKQIGRRAFALELVERDKQRIAARADESQYRYRTIDADPRWQRGKGLAKRLGGGVAHSRIAHLSDHATKEAPAFAAAPPDFYLDLDRPRRAPPILFDHLKGHAEPSVRRYAAGRPGWDSSFNEEYRKKKPKFHQGASWAEMLVPPQEFRKRWVRLSARDFCNGPMELGPTLELGNLPEESRTMVEVSPGRFVNSVSAEKLGLKPMKPEQATRRHRGLNTETNYERAKSRKPKRLPSVALPIFMLPWPKRRRPISSAFRILRDSPS
jgi:hypothetical protein